MSEICFKRLSVAFVVLFLILSLAEILYGSYILYVYFQILQIHILIQSFVFQPATLLIGIGVITLLLICFGTMGTLQEVICCIECYATCLILFAILQVGTGIYFLDVYNSLNDFLQRQITSSVQESFITNNEKQMFNIHQIVHCCGFNSPLDWKNYTLPESCCSPVYGNITSCNINSTNLYQEGCEYEVFYFIMSTNSILNYVNIGNGIIQTIAAITSCVFSCCYLRKYQRFEQ